MDIVKSQDELDIVIALLHDASASFGAVFNSKVLRLTTCVVKRRYFDEGIGFLTKTLPRLGRHLDQVLANRLQMDPISCGFKPTLGSKLPRFLGELFQLVVGTDGYVLPSPNAKCVQILREILYAFYKYELPNTDEQEQIVLAAFKAAENDLRSYSSFFDGIEEAVKKTTRFHRRTTVAEVCSELAQTHLGFSYSSFVPVVRAAQRALERVFTEFDGYDILPRHGPGAVATKQTFEQKFRWTNVSSSITDIYPFDAYFCASIGHVCDTFQQFSLLKTQSLPARVVLVPKDSRGPRLISCEPVDNQWIQQGLMGHIVPMVESHPLTRGRVNFTDQSINRDLALKASLDNSYVTLDLKEASDRVHLRLVRLLFPERVIPFLECCRSSSTVLPCGEEYKLDKFAPMGSALCFPIMALTIWSLLYAVAPDALTRKSIYVYGDDVIVPRSFSASAMSILEFFGLRINQNKSCIHGPFKESCGMDAFQGIDVTPVRFRTVWKKSPSPDAYSSWIASANQYYSRGRLFAYDSIVSKLEAVYGPVPEDEGEKTSYPSLRLNVRNNGRFKTRWNRRLQKRQIFVRTVRSRSFLKETDGWSMLLRYFTEGTKTAVLSSDRSWSKAHAESKPFMVREYTKRRTSKLVRCWR